MRTLKVLLALILVISPLLSFVPSVALGEGQKKTSGTAELMSVALNSIDNEELLTESGYTVGYTNSYTSLFQPQFTIRMRGDLGTLQQLILLDMFPPFSKLDPSGIIKYQANNLFRVFNGEQPLNADLVSDAVDIVTDKFTKLDELVDVATLSQEEKELFMLLKKIIEADAGWEEIQDVLVPFNLYKLFKLDNSVTFETSNVLQHAIRTAYPGGSYEGNSYYYNNDKLYTMFIDKFDGYSDRTFDIRLVVLPKKEKLKLKVNAEKTISLDHDQLRLFLYDLTQLMKGRETKTVYANDARDLMRSYHLQLANKAFEEKMEVKNLELFGAKHLHNGHLLLPLSLLEDLEVDIQWDPIDKMLIASRGHIKLELIEGAKTMKVQVQQLDESPIGKQTYQVSLSNPMKMIGDEVFLPLRAVTEAFSVDAVFDKAQSELHMTTVNSSKINIIVQTGNGCGLLENTAVSGLFEVHAEGESHFYFGRDFAKEATVQLLSDGEVIREDKSKSGFEFCVKKDDEKTIQLGETYQLKVSIDGFNDYTETITIEALANINKKIELEPASLNYFYYEMAMGEYNIGRAVDSTAYLNEAIRYVEKSINHQANHLNYYLKTLILIELEQYEDAIKANNVSITFKETDNNFYLRSYITYKLNRCNEALALINQHLEKVGSHQQLEKNYIDLKRLITSSRTNGFCSNESLEFNEVFKKVLEIDYTGFGTFTGYPWILDSENQLYTTNNASKMFIHDANTGKKAIEKELKLSEVYDFYAGSNTISLVKNNNGQVYIGLNGKIASLDTNLNEQQTFKLDGSPLPITITESGNIYVTTRNHKLYLINPDLTEAITFDLDNNGRVSSPVVADDGTVYVSIGRSVYAIKSDLSGYEWEQPFDVSKLNKYYTDTLTTPVIGNDGTIYVSGGNILQSINTDGTMSGTARITNDSSFTQPAIGKDGLVYVTENHGAPTNRHALVAYAPGLAVKEFVFDLDVIDYSKLTQPVIDKEGNIYIGKKNFDNHWLYRVNPYTRKNAEYQADIGLSLPRLFEQNETIYVGTSRGILAFEVGTENSEATEEKDEHVITEPDIDKEQGDTTDSPIDESGAEEREPEHKEDNISEAVPEQDLDIQAPGNSGNNADQEQQDINDEHFTESGERSNSEEVIDFPIEENESDSESTIGQKETEEDQVVDECFIATAAYGSKFEPSVTLLRNFRDQVLLTNGLGEKFVEFYYEHSPPIAKLIADNEGLKSVVKILLLPALIFAYAALHPVISAFIVGSFMLILVFALGLNKHRLRGSINQH